MRGTVASFRALGVLTVMSASFCDFMVGSEGITSLVEEIFGAGSNP